MDTGFKKYCIFANTANIFTNMKNIINNYLIFVLVSIFIISVTLFISSCGDDDEPIIEKEEPPIPPGNNNGNNNTNNNITYYFIGNTYKIGEKAGNRTIYVQTNTEWEFQSITSSITGFSISCPPKGAGDFSFKISYSDVPNPNDWSEGAYIYFKVKWGTSQNSYYETKSIYVFRRGKKTAL